MLEETKIVDKIVRGFRPSMQVRTPNVIQRN